MDLFLYKTLKNQFFISRAYEAADVARAIMHRHVAHVCAYVRVCTCVRECN